MTPQELSDLHAADRANRAEIDRVMAAHAAKTGSEHLAKLISKEPDVAALSADNARLRALCVANSINPDA